MDSKLAREQIFRHLDGMVTIPVATLLHKKGVLKALNDQKKHSLSDLTQQFSAKKGYLNVALRVLASQGFVDYEVNNQSEEIHVSANANTTEFIASIHWYELVEPLTKKYGVEDFMGKEADPHHPIFEIMERFIELTSTQNSDSSIAFQMKKHTEGYLMAPMIVHLGMSGMFHKYFMESSFSAEEFHQQPAVFKRILDFFTANGWFTSSNDHYQFTEEGLFFAKRAAAYGVTVSYLPIFLQLEDMIFGSAANKLRDNTTSVDEIHVDRAMNVWGSGGAHTTYFKVLDDFIIDLFNRPLNEQPKGILDMGCGNGALLHHLYNTIERSTLRGKHLEEYPLFLVGADYNQAALKITRANLIANDIWAKVIWGDIGNPALLAEDLKKNYNIELSDLVNMRTFLDHNRVWEDPGTTDLISESTGAFAHRGAWISNNQVEYSLQKHLEKWKPYVSKNGLILIELHTVDPKITARNIGRTPATAYDATHGFSDQYILEVDVFQKAAQAAGMTIDPHLFKKFPATDYATVSINYLK